MISFKVFTIASIMEVFKCAVVRIISVFITRDAESVIISIVEKRSGEIIEIFEIIRRLHQVAVSLVASWCWWLKVDDNFRMFATELRSQWHLILRMLVTKMAQSPTSHDCHGDNVITTYRLQHPPPTSM